MIRRVQFNRNSLDNFVFLSVHRCARGRTLSDPSRKVRDYNTSKKKNSGRTLKGKFCYIIPREKWLGHPVVFVLFDLRKLTVANKINPKTDHLGAKKYRGLTRKFLQIWYIKQTMRKKFLLVKTERLYRNRQ